MQLRRCRGARTRDRREQGAAGCHISMPHLHTTSACHVCMPRLHATSACHVCMPTGAWMGRRRPASDRLARGNGGSAPGAVRRAGPQSQPSSVGGRLAWRARAGGRACRSARGMMEVRGRCSDGQTGRRVERRCVVYDVPTAMLLTSSVLLCCGGAPAGTKRP